MQILDPVYSFICEKNPVFYFENLQPAVTLAHWVGVSMSMMLERLPEWRLFTSLTHFHKIRGEGMSEN